MPDAVVAVYETEKDVTAAVKQFEHDNYDMSSISVLPGVGHVAIGGYLLYVLTGAGVRVAVDLAATWHHNGPAVPTQHAVMRHVGEAARADMDEGAVAAGAGDGHVGTFNRHGLSDAFRVEP